MARREGQSQTLIYLRLVQDAEFDRVNVELAGQFIQRRFRGVETGYSSGAAHIGPPAGVSLGASEGHAQIGHAVLERGGLAAVLMMCVKHRTRVDVIMV